MSWPMALTRKNLMLDADQVAALAARRATSESAAVREAVEAALFVEEFGAAMEALRATGYGTDDRGAWDDPRVRRGPRDAPADDRPDAPEIGLQIVPEWPRRMLSSGRPRDPQRFAPPGMRAGVPRIRTLLVMPETHDIIKQPTLIFVPARGTYARNTPMGMKDGYAERAQLGHEARGRNDIGTLTLTEGVEQAFVSVRPLPRPERAAPTPDATSGAGRGAHLREVRTRPFLSVDRPWWR